MEVKLINKPTLEFIDSGIGMCWDKGSYSSQYKQAGISLPSMHSSILMCFSCRKVSSLICCRDSL